MTKRLLRLKVQYLDDLAYSLTTTMLVDGQVKEDIHKLDPEKVVRTEVRNRLNALLPEAAIPQ